MTNIPKNTSISVYSSESASLSPSFIVRLVEGGMAKRIAETNLETRRREQLGMDKSQRLLFLHLATLPTLSTRLQLRRSLDESANTTDSYQWIHTMEASGDANVYCPLNIENREIRVLEILPPDPTLLRPGTKSKITMELKTCSLESPVAYEALSYTTWGDPRKQQPSASIRPRTSSSDKTLSRLCETCNL
jgi:hypothetical protein